MTAMKPITGFRKVTAEANERLVPATLKTRSIALEVRPNRAHFLCNRMGGAILLLLALPLMLLIAAALLLTQGREIFYGGARYGKDRALFNIYKFRTLDSDKAKALTRDKVLPPGTNIETPLGKFLRDSRLDELPQLWNVVRGDMDLVGPRPVRPEMARLEELKNPHFGIRFAVKPGLVGQMQAYMTHGTSERIRSKFNYQFCTARTSYRRDVILLARVGLAVLAKTVNLITSKILREDPEKVGRSIAEDWSLSLRFNGLTYPVRAFNADGITLENQSLYGPAELLITTNGGGLRRAKIMLKRLPVSATSLSSHSFAPTTELSNHLILRYLHDTAVVGPRPPARAHSESANNARRNRHAIPAE